MNHRVGFLIEIIDKIIHYFDKLVGYEPKSVLVDQPLITQPTSNLSKLFELL